MKDERKDKRSVKYNFRMSDSEKEALVRLAAASGLAVSAYIRTKLFHGEKTAINAVEFMKQYKQQVFQLSKIGNNINQLAHYANICISKEASNVGIIEEMNKRLGELILCERTISELEKKLLK